jgi:hypothetical protein
MANFQGQTYNLVNYIKIKVNNITYFIHFKSEIKSKGKETQS